MRPKNRSNYPDFTDCFTDYDILCYVETKLDNTDIVSLPGFECISQPRKEFSFRRSGGVALFIKSEIAKFCKLKPSESDYIMWVHIDKHLIDTDENLILGIIYVPPIQSRFYNDDELSKLENEIMSVCCSNKYVTISGDINARTAKLPDYVKLDQYISDQFDFDDDIANFFDKTEILKNLNIPVERSSMDVKTNNTGYWLTDVCKNNNLFIVNGRVGKDKGIGRKTFRKTSTIDYTICTANCFPFLTQFEVIELDPIFSDGHSLLSWSLNINLTTNDTNDKPAYYTNSRSKWSEKDRDIFVSSIDMQQVLSLHETLDTISPSPEAMENITENIAQIFNNASSKAFKPKKKIFSRRKFDKPWFGPACKIARKKYHRARNIYNINKNPINKQNLNSISKQYKQTIKNTCLNTKKIK